MTKARDIASMLTSTQTLANKTLASTTTFPDAHSFKLYVASDYTFGTQTSATKILLDTALSNSFGSNLSNNSFTPTVTGRYFLMAQVDMNTKNNEMMWAYIYNGSTVIGHKAGWLDNSGTASTAYVVSFSMIADITAGDHIYLYAKSGQTMSKTIKGGITQTSLSGFKIVS